MIYTVIYIGEKMSFLVLGPSRHAGVQQRYSKYRNKEFYVYEDVCESRVEIPPAYLENIEDRTSTICIRY